MANATPTGCPAPATLVALTSGTLPEAEAAAWRHHLETCGSCTPQRTSTVERQDVSTSPDVTGEIGIVVSKVTVEAPALAAGASVGRYTILEKLGEGGMGMVYAAYDAELHRKVALKLLHGQHGSADAADLGRARLLREAQALAQLSHHNVVGVHEVGTHEHRVFMAMEFVEGQSLRAWLKEKPRCWREVLPIFLEAAEGLRAAHQKGLIHRDFKPDNVLLGTDGRVRVLDFGLARGAVELSRDAGPPRKLPLLQMVEESTGSSLSTPLTQPGQVMGTLPYMAPELLLGAPAEVRTDVFAFFVSLYEALYNERPFKKHGDRHVPPEPPRAAKVPAWLRRVVLKGLLPEPEARYGSFDQVLAALRSDPAPARRRLLAAAAALVTVALAVTGAYRLAGHKSQLCRHEAERLQGVWDGPTAERLRKVFLASGAPAAEDTWNRTRKVLDDAAQQVVAMRTEACEDTRVKGSQPDTVLGLRMACLDRRLSELKAFTEVLGQANKAMVMNAVKAAAKLTPPDICANLTALRAPVPLPDSPAERQQVEAGRKLLARAKALEDTGQLAPSMAAAEQGLAVGQAVHYRPLEAEAAYAKAHVQLRLDPKGVRVTAHQAFLAALAGSEPEVAVNAASEMVYALGLAGDKAGVTQWEQLAHAELEAAGGSRPAEMILENSLGVALLNLDRKQAELHLRRGLALSEQGRGGMADVIIRISTRTNLALDLANMGRSEEALRLDREALALTEKSFGPQNPHATVVKINLGSLITEYQGPTDESVQLVEQALTAGTAGPVDEVVALDTLGIAHALRGELHRAVSELRNLISRSEALFGPEGLDMAVRHLGLSEAELALGSLAAAREEATVALAIAQHTANGAQMASAKLVLGEIALEANERERSLELLMEARTGLLKSPSGPLPLADVDVAHAEWCLAYHQPAQAEQLLQHVLEVQRRESPKFWRIAITRLRLGQAQVDRREYAEAIANLMEAERRFVAAQVDPALLAQTHFTWARALWDSGKDKPRALALAREAKLEFGRSESHLPHERAALDAWLAHRPL